MARALRQAGRAGDDDVVVLLTNELVTNAILHADSEIDVVVDVTGGRVRVEVRDRATRAPRRRWSEPTATAGRGLALVEALASDWGVDAIPGEGKAVWFEVAV